MNGNGERPVSHAELKQELGLLRDELRGEMGELRQEVSQLRKQIPLEIAGAMGYFADRIGDQMERMEGRLSRQIASAALAAAEQNRTEIGVVDDRYRDLPGRVAAVERELDEHRRDPAAHRGARSGGKRR